MERRPRELGIHGQDDVVVFSTRRFSSSEDRLTIEGLGAKVAAAHDIFIAAAFYDVEFCSKLLSFASGKLKRLRLMFNGLGGTRLLGQRAELIELERTLRRTVTNCQVRLAFVPGTFDTKLMVLSAPRFKTAFVGSANPTMAALNLNEEIVVEVPAGPRVAGYIDRIWAEASPVGTVEDKPTARSLIAFFRTGSLYFKPTTALQTTFNPFAPLLSALPDVERRKLGTATLPHSDQEVGIGPFDLKRAAGLKATGGDARDDDKSSNASIKPFAVETCFGYWVPRAEEQALHDMLAKVGETKRRRLLELRAVLERVEPAKLREQFAEYVQAVKERLARANVVLPKRGTTSELPLSFDAFCERTMRSLSSDDYVERLCSPFVRGAMPELWNDSVAYADFASTFFQYIEYVAQRAGNPHRVPGTILRRIGLKDLKPSDHQIKTALEAHVAKHGWKDSDWVISK